MRVSNGDTAQIAGRAGILRRLRHDVAGNTIMLVTGALLPLVALAGSGIDMGRIYMVKSRLQQACDAGALSARKSMGGGTVFTTAMEQTSQAFFKNNFTPGMFGTVSTTVAGSNLATFTPTKTSDNQISATANVRVQWSIMQVPKALLGLSGPDYTDVSVVCGSRQDLANSDIMFVLDVTGSMLNCPDDTTCNGNSSSKIAGLRTAVINFYNTLVTTAPATSQIRFGFMPYSTNVNIGGSLPTSVIADSHSYQSVVANMNTPAYTKTDTSIGSPAIQVYNSGASITQSSCTSYGTNYGTSYVATSGGPAPAAINGTAYSNNSSAGVDWGYPGALDTSGTSRSCRRKAQTVSSTFTINGYGFTNWVYKKVPINVMNFRSGASVSYATSAPTGLVPSAGEYNLVQLAAIPAAGTTNSSATWDKCIEERDTVAYASTASVPSGAYDLQIDTQALTEATKWRPTWPAMIFDRSGTASETSTSSDPSSGHGQPPSWCSTPALKLAVVGNDAPSLAWVTAYVNALSPNGWTYHDVGMAWGARFVNGADNAIFATENDESHPAVGPIAASGGLPAIPAQAAGNGRTISRHIVFMTDGDMCTQSGIYGFQGVEKLDQRVMGGTASSDCDDSQEHNKRHTARFLEMCRAAKSMNISIWTIAFGTANPPSLINCANTGQSYVATDTAALSAAFTTIASKIAALKLTQ